MPARRRQAAPGPARSASAIVNRGPNNGASRRGRQDAVAPRCHCAASDARSAIMLSQSPSGEAATGSAGILPARRRQAAPGPASSASAIVNRGPNNGASRRGRQDAVAPRCHCAASDAHQRQCLHSLQALTNDRTHGRGSPTHWSARNNVIRIDRTLPPRNNRARASVTTRSSDRQEYGASAP